MRNTPHRSVQTPFIIKRVYNDANMLVFLEGDPLNEYINLTIAHESDYLKDKFINKVGWSLNPQSCDLQEPDKMYSTSPEFDIPSPPSIVGIVTSGALEEQIALNIVDDIRDFYSKRITRAEYDSKITNTYPYDVRGIIYANNKYDRKGHTYLSLDTNPGDSGSLYIYDEDDLSATPTLSYLTRVTTYEDEFLKIDPEDISWDILHTGAGHYPLPNTPVGTVKVYDLLHLDHGDEPIQINSAELTINDTGVKFNAYPSGRPSYNSTYYDTPGDSGQPDRFWTGIYGIKYTYTPIDEISSGLSCDGYFQDVPDDESEIIYPATPKAQWVELPVERITELDDYDYMFKVHPKYVRPGSTVRISATYTKLTEQTWADASVAFSYTIADADFLETNAEAVKIKYNGQLVEATATVSGNTITVSPLASAIIDYYGSAYTVEIYYKAKSIKLDTVETAYDHNNTYYEGQYGIDEQGRIIPMSIMGVDFTGITEDYSYPKVTVETQYDLRGLAYDPYRKAFWSIENNNKYLTLRSSNNLSIITNYSLYMDRTISPFYIDDVRHYLYNYTPQTIINFASLKYYEGMLYILSTNGTLYTLNPHYDLAPIDFEFDDDGNLEYTPIALSHASAPVDFTFDRDGNLLVTEPDGEIQKYNCYRDYAFVDRENNEVYFREKYDYIDIDDTPGSV